MAHKINVSVASLQPSQFEGWATKQGGGWKSWKRRWFVIKDRKMWYFVGKNDTEAKGWIDLTPGTEVRDVTEPGQKKKFCFVIKSRGAKGEREFPIFVESETDLKGFLKAINQVLQGDKKPAAAPKPNNFAPPNVNATSAPPANEPVAPPPMTTAFVPQTKDDELLDSLMDPVPQPPVPQAEPEPQPPAPVAEPEPQPAPVQQPAVTKPVGFGARPGGFGANRFGARPAQQQQSAPPSLNIPANVNRKTVPEMLQTAIDMSQWLKSNNPEGILDFLGIWRDSLPVNTDMEMGEIADVKLVVSANTHKLSWRVDGPQGALIQKMIDFFWNVGAPETEIDRLNDLGAEINPMFIGSWIDMSQEGGMDGGWYFPVDTDLTIGKQAGDADGPSNCLAKMIDWAQKNGLNMISSIGRDMGATPPRQTEFKFQITGPASAKLNVIKDGLSTFGIPALPEKVESALNAFTGNEIMMSVTTSTDGFVRVAVIIPQPNAQVLSQVVESVSEHDIAAHQQYLNTFGQPVAVEYSFLSSGFGFEVYREGADAHVHYLLGNVTP